MTWCGTADNKIATLGSPAEQWRISLMLAARHKDGGQARNGLPTEVCFSRRRWAVCLSVIRPQPDQKLSRIILNKCNEKTRQIDIGSVSPLTPLSR
jgi:hypothetical protein